MDKTTIRQKPQSNGMWGEDIIQIMYDVPNNRIQVWKFEGKAWMRVGKDIPIKFVDGDVFTVYAGKDGTVEIYRAEKLLSTRQPAVLQVPTPTLTETPIQKDASASELMNFMPVRYNLPAPARDTWNQTLGTLTIDYTYDPLNRLTSATYSDGRSFGYSYDASGNVLELEQNLGPGTIITTYTYDTANQLETAQQGSTTWQYTYDANGSLISDGVKNYTYDSANRLVQVSDQLSVTSLSYNGLGQRLSMDAAGVIATYVLDGDRPLTATSNGNTTFYLYGLGGIGEETNAWSYSLPDGTNTPRQLSDLSGEITLSARYTPWGDTLDSFGTGNFTFGYLGGVLDATTGLLYVGNGQYYDPSTGRFLTRSVNPDSTNPYTPWNPSGIILAPLAVLSLVYGRKRKRGKWDTLVILLLLGASTAIGIVACAPAPTLPSGFVNTEPPAMPAQSQTPVSTGSGTILVGKTGTPPAPIETPIPIPCPTPTLTEVSLDAEFLKYGINLNGQIASWKMEWKMAALAGIKAVADKFGSVMQLPPVVAFVSVFSEGINITMGLEGALYACALITAGGCTSSSTQINFVPNLNLAFLDAVENRTADMAYIANRNLVVHEIGHVFANKIPTRIDDPNSSDPSVTKKNPDHPSNKVGSYQNKILLSDAGWPVSPVSADRTWRQHPCSDDQGSDDQGTCYEIEVFADMFLGWTFDVWGLEARAKEIVGARKNFMYEYMPHWLKAFK